MRAPARPGSMFYVENVNANINQYKSNKVDTVYQDRLRRHSQSYFAYSGYDRLYKFFRSPEFFALERRYRSLYALDVGRCFSSIYTHSISWAVKSKTFSKGTTSITSTFGQRFDAAMQRSNYNETNGIPVGPEVSRIFAEIILQDVDRSSTKLLENEHKLFDGVQYTIKRYVDDIFIFSDSPEVSETVRRVYSDYLEDYKLYLNDAKERRYERPFLTEQSRASHLLSDEIGRFFSQISCLEPGKNGKIRAPKYIFRPTSLAQAFISRVKLACTDLDGDVSLASNYVLSAFCRKIQDAHDAYIDSSSTMRKLEDRLERYLRTLLEVMFYIYGLAPSVSTSFEVARAVLLSSRLLSQRFPGASPSLNQRIIELATETLRQETLVGQKEHRGYVPLEKLNILLALSDLGESYLLPRDQIAKIFSFEDRDAGYFATMCCLYYIKDFDDYSEIKVAIEKYIDEKLGDLDLLATSSEAAHFFLDALSCPFLGNNYRRALLSRWYQRKQPNRASGEIDEAISFMKENEWFTNWGSIDLLNAVERKRLTRTY